jgi:tetratricopeptide (TPR) repeat protein
VLQNLEDIPDRLRDLVFTNAEGNPFYVEELVKMLIEEGVILKEEPHWRVQSERLYDIKVPPSLAGVLQARLDRLPADVRTVLQQASVIGRIFWDDALVAFHDQADDQTYTAVVNDSLNLLRDREMVFQRQSSAFAGTKERIFKHILLRDVTYETVLKRLRLSYHRLAADWLIANSKERLDEMAGVIAAHLDAAGDNLRAIKYFRQAAAIAKALYAHQEAINHLKRAIELAAEEQEERDLIPQLYEALGDSLTITGKFASAEEAYQAALACLPTGEPVELAELERKLAATLPPQQREAESEAIYLAALARLDRSPPTTVDQRWQSIRLNNLLGLQDVLYFLHQPEAMSELKEQTQALLDEVGTAEQHASFYSRLNQMSFLQNRYYMSSENVALARKALRYAQKSENARLIARQRFHLGFSLLWHGDLDDAVAVLQKSLATAKELGDSWLQNQCLVYLTIPYRLQGNISQVMVLQPDLIEISRQVGNKTYIGVSLANAAWLHYRAGEWRQAQAQAEAAVATWDSTMYPFQWLALWILLAVALQRDRLPDAIDVARAMLDSEQQQQEGVHVFLEKAVAAWEANDQSTSQIRLATAVELASQHSYV